MCATILHPLTADIDEFEKAKLFTARCYKFLMPICTGDETSTMVTPILGTGASPNLVQENVLPNPRLVNVQAIRAIIRAAGDTTFRVKGVIRLTVNIGGQKGTTVFGVAPRLATKFILDTAFIDLEMKT